MNTLTIKIPSELEQEIVLASQREHLSKSELVRRALVAYVSQHRLASITGRRWSRRAIWWAALAVGRRICLQTLATLMTLAACEQPSDSGYRPLGGPALPG